MMPIRTAELARSTGFNRMPNPFADPSAPPPDNLETMLGRLRRDLKGQIVILASYDFLARGGRLHAADNVQAEYFRTYPAHPSVAEFFPRRVRESEAAGAPWTEDELAADGAFRVSAFYRSWLRPQGVAHLIGGIIRREGAEVTFVLVGRGEAAGRFAVQELSSFRALLPLLGYGADMRSLVARLQQASRVDLKIFDLLPIGIIVLDRNDQLMASNNYARRALGSGGLAGLSALRARARSIDCGRRTESLRGIDAAVTPTAGMAGRAVLLERGDELRPLSAVIFSHDGSDVDETNGVSIVFISDPDHAPSIDRERLQSFYGLTPAEARLTALLAEGQHLDAAAASLGITLHTARTHLKRIFSKMVVESQADLVRQALDLTNQIGFFGKALGWHIGDALLLMLSSGVLLSA